MASTRARSRTQAPPEGHEADRPPRRRSELLARVLVAIPAAIVAVAFISFGGFAFAAFMVALGWVCMYELYRMLERWRPLPLVAFASLAGMVLAAHYGSEQAILEVAVGTIPVLFVMQLLRAGRANSTITIAGTLLGVFWLGLAFAHAVLLRRLPHGGAVLIDVLIGTFLGDTAAYVGGRAFGRRALAPSVSPNKTIEGLFWGSLVAILAVFLAGLGQPWLTQGDALLLGVAVAVFAPLGDLFESAIKRDARTKDAGRVFGPHGGALDRLDAALFTIVAGYYVWIAVMH